jgi:hypothetical protein
MNKLIAGLFGVALLSGSAFADTGAPAPSAKDLSKAVEKVNYVETDVTGVKLSGYVDVGYVYNFTSSPVTNRVGTDGAAAGDFSVNAVKLTLEKALNNKNEWQAGFRTDLMVGEDAGTFNGSDNFGSASEFFLEQGYVIFRAPFGNGIDIKAGKFASWLGYEVTERPANLNITYSQMYAFLPATMTGVSFEYPVNNNIDLGLAVGNGAGDSNFGTANNSSSPYTGGGSNDGYAIMAKINLKNNGGNLNWQNSVYYTWDSSYELSNDPAFYNYNNNAFIYDSVLNWAPKFANGKLLLGVNGDLAYVQGDTAYAGDKSSTLFGLAGYAKYQFTDLFSLAGRVAYVHVDDADTSYANRPGFGTGSWGGSFFAEDNWSATLTAGFNVAENLVIRAEYRVDIGNETTFNGGDIAHTAAVQAVYTF